MTRYWWY